MHPWVAARRNAVHFGLQVFALPEDPHPTKRILRAGQLAEELGFDAFFIGDHPGYQTEAWTHLAAISARTERIGLGSVVNCASYRHPALIARLAGDLDNISEGRAILGLGIGWNEVEFKQLGIPFTSVRERQEAMSEALRIMTGMFQPEPITLHGKHWWVEGARYGVPGVRQEMPPVLIAGAGERVTFAQVATYADISNFGEGANSGRVRGSEDIQRKFDVLRSHCDAIGRPYDSILRSHFTNWTMVAPTQALAEAKRDRYYPNGLSDEQKITRVIGTPETVLAYYQSLADAGFQYFVVQVLDAADEETFRLLATEVMPNVRPAQR